ncbi:Zinc finger ZZ-type domain containing protein [Klebsormidium nitens]|uniref:Zinc finger ZZ-type domain containing protein n=1 Tax=Klebsormidium nitens TaxID=105231 RepID=A0A1Y1I3G3_KLENI|nr:Zinc finger ZZ-type domain containing protein [Klebsormidium nitens]|eukprot:GAQ83276.1 Zinc finger ZZ-type domain containing protein [Klebsormidium nitens]
MELAPAFQPRVEEYECAICKDLVFKPAVNVCQHMFCFWCLHQSMNNVSESNCPLCRREYGHLARTCGLLHFFLGNAFPIEYRERQAEILADRERREIAAEDLETDPVLLEPSPRPQPPAETFDIAQTSSSEQPPNQFLSGGATGAVLRLNGPSGASTSGGQRRPYPYAGPETKFAFRGVDFGCKLCSRLLHDPSVLVCGHVFCLSCIRTRSSDPRCPLCRIMQAESPGNLVPCATIADLVSRAFPEASAARAREAAAQEASSGAAEPTAPPPERPPTVQAAMSRTRSLLLSAHADLVRRGEPFNLRAMTERLLEDLGPKYVVHFGVGCDGCGQSPIVGERYQCKGCQEALGFDMCGHCYEMGGAVRGLFDQRHSREHRVVKIPPLAALTSRHFGIDPYRVLFTNPELPYQAVQRMRDEMHGDGELEFLLGELEDADLPDSPQSFPSDPGYGPPSDPPSERGFRATARSTEYHPSYFDGDFDSLGYDSPVARHRIGRSLRLPGSPRGGESQAVRHHGGDSDGAPANDATPPSERSNSPGGLGVWTRRVGRDPRLGGVSGRGGSGLGRLGGPGSNQPGALRRVDGGFLSDPRAGRLSAWLETMPPDYPEPQRAARHGARGGDVRARHGDVRLRNGDVVARDGDERTSALEMHNRLMNQFARETRSGAESRPGSRGEGSSADGHQSGNDSGTGSDGESIRGEWHDVHEGGVEGQEVRPPRFGERRLRRSFGRRHVLPFPLPEPPAAEVTSAAEEVEMDEPDVTSVQQPEGDVARERERRVVDAGTLSASPDNSSEEDPLSWEPPRPQIRRVQVYPSDSMIRSRSAWETGGGLGDSPGPRRRRSMDGLPPLPPRRRALSASPLERRAGLLMLTLASTAAEHPSFGGGARNEDSPSLGAQTTVSVERSRPVIARELQQSATEREAASGGAPFAAVGSIEQELLAGYATQFDSRRTLQDMQTDSPPAGGGGSANASLGGTGPPVSHGYSADVTLTAADVTAEGGGTLRRLHEPNGETPAQHGADAEGGGQEVGLAREREGLTRPPAAAHRQSYSLVDSLVRALGGQRRRPRDVQPEAAEASPSQVRRLRRPEE